MRKVLVVDDSALVRSQLKATLTPVGFEVVEAADGRIALDTLLGRNDISLVICDVNMPRMSGIDLLQALPKDRPMPPVIMLTTEAQPDLIRQAKNAGARGWIVKPFREDRLISAVNAILTATTPP